LWCIIAFGHLTTKCAGESRHLVREAVRRIIKEANLPSTIEYLPEKGYTLNRAAGQNSPDITIECVTEMIEVSTRHDCSNLLADLRETTLIAATIDTFELPKRFEKLGLSPEHKLAIVYSEAESDYQFLETVSRNKGLQVRVFVDFDEAENWLK
jgi:hypothetical protein